MTDGDIMSHMGLVRTLAAKVAWRIPRHRDDLIAAGALGLVQAARRFDRTRGRFSPYAYRRIRGAMQDFLRGERNPGNRVRGDSTVRREPLSEDFPDLRQDSVAEVARRERNGRLALAVSALSPKQSAVIRASFFAGRNLRQIGQQEGITESRVCQIWQSALRELRRIVRIA